MTRPDPVAGGETGESNVVRQWLAGTAQAGRVPPWYLAVPVAFVLALLSWGEGAVAESSPESSHPPVRLSEIRKGRLLIRDGHLERARAVLEQARPSGEAERIERLRLLGQVEMQLGMPGRAARRFKEILALRPGQAGVRRELLRACRLSRGAEDLP